MMVLTCPHTYHRNETCTNHSRKTEGLPLAHRELSPAVQTNNISQAKARGSMRQDKSPLQRKRFGTCHDCELQQAMVLIEVL